ncbi:phospholipase A2 inhibitor and Ly6/PLAUR domain-containing protein-like isoform X3 [Bufo bufo]|uniref:phospholipase A2 inhibitor and Ly6/PLAUR domain-containing protein-like isoform X3 n=1 Tax=Bufo bufo TaxID=8384 RepID=UPI001ABDD34C|nr:phospholipase A2 inhibitor and Ly6/PLAUR domain-containing protein-like isoform X3 [Bufo bufo]
MSSLIGILSLLSALAATSYALLCTYCISNETTCSGTSITCYSGLQCGSTYTETTIAGMKSTSLGRICAPSSQCGLKGSVGLQQGHIRMSTSCCNTDNCAPDPPTYATTSSTPNGLVCRSCMSADSTWCYTDDTVQCTGDENMCLLMTTYVSGSMSASTAIRGCASKSICDIGSQSASAGGVTSDVKFICTSGGLSVHNIVLTPAIVCLLLLKLFF